jgi:hypothetical protein
MRTRLFASAIFLMLPAAAQASEFWYVAEGQTYSFWLDAQTMKTDDPRRTVTVYQIYSELVGNGIRVAMAPAEFECAAKTVSFLPGIGLGDRLIPVSQFDERPAVKIGDGTVLAQVETFVCGRTQDRAKNGKKFGNDATSLNDVVAAYLRTYSK